MRIMGLDYGERRIGVAVSDELGLTAQGVESYTRQGRRADLAHLAAKAGELGAELIVVGLPLNMNGTRGPAAEEAEAFGRDLARMAGCGVVFVDERLTTAAAQRDLAALDVSRARRRKVVDRTAAALILQGYLDRSGRTLASDREQGEH